jgi:hypothetical protein
MTGEETTQCAEERISFLQHGGRADERGRDPIHVNGIKQLSILNELSYWKVGFGI